MNMRGNEDTCRKKPRKLLHCMRVFNVDGIKSGVPGQQQDASEVLLLLLDDAQKRDQTHKAVLWGFAMLHYSENVVA